MAAVRCHLRGVVLVPDHQHAGSRLFGIRWVLGRCGHHGFRVDDPVLLALTCRQAWPLPLSRDDGSDVCSTQQLILR